MFVDSGKILMVKYGERNYRGHYMSMELRITWGCGVEIEEVENGDMEE